MLKIFRLPLKKWVVSGYRFGEKTGNKKIPKHYAVDLRANFEDGFAPQDGDFMLLHQNDPDAGMWALLDCGDIVYHFMHLSKTYVEGTARAGEKIFKTGNSGGNTTGPHLHMGIKNNGEWIDPQQFMTYTILLKNQSSKELTEAIKRVVLEFFARGGVIVVFETEEAPNLGFWGLMTITDAGGSWCDTKDTHNTPGYYDIAFGWNSLAEGPNRQPQDIIIHEILHGMFEDLKLPDIHDFNLGVETNQKAFDLLLKFNNKEMMQLYGNADAKARHESGESMDPPNQYLLGNDGVLHLITNGEMLEDLAAAGIVEPVGVRWISEKELKSMRFGRDWAALDNK